jgi:hypothetical protein
MTTHKVAVLLDFAANAANAKEGSEMVYERDFDICN